MLPWIGGLAPTPSHKSPVLVDTVARPRHTCWVVQDAAMDGCLARPHRTCPGFCRENPGCLGMLPWMGGRARPHHTCPGFCRAVPGCSGMLPWMGSLAPTPSHKLPVLIDIVARPCCTCPGF